MKVAVYGANMELLGVVDVDQSFVDIGVKRGFVELAVIPEMKLEPYSATGPISDALQVTRIVADVKVLRALNGAQTIMIVVADRAAMAMLRKARVRQLWPRKRAKRDGYRASKSHKRLHRLPYPQTHPWQGDGT